MSRICHDNNDNAFDMCVWYMKTGRQIVDHVKREQTHSLNLHKNSNKTHHFNLVWCGYAIIFLVW